MIDSARCTDFKECFNEMPLFCPFVSDAENCPHAIPKSALNLTLTQ